VRFSRPIRRDGGTIVVELAEPDRQLVAVVAEGVRHVAESPTSPGFARLYNPLDESAVDDAPLATLERQMAIDRLCDTVHESCRAERITDEQAEAWMKVLGMAAALAAANAGIRTEADTEAMAPDLSALVDFLRALQVMLAVGLDPSLEDLEVREPD
jgi:hypothetical protein